ncbi:CpsB/CapC family capsule biosynthesis tyrosine phosphatase [Paenibacillus sp. ACRRX]|uniref:tyrosine-protein phosphatase n=1 Tax=Paenibacillus sp. ACRRX TaxID=2918206 RepID=UPI0023B7BE33|nr:CpsB/CapC family capsule biosynthesis tyrosine phosphatase [Paenibacillus sp. ACRRX]
MIDIHTHILPCVDDGATSMAMSISMARRASAQGIRYMLATPHHRNGLYVNPAPLIHQAVDHLNKELQRSNIDLLVYPGQEIRVYDRLLQDLTLGLELLSLNGSRYVLLEIPSTHIPPRLRELVYEVCLLGKVPILAHPERNLEVMSSPTRLAELVQEGALCQVTSHSLNGNFGKKVKKLAWELCKQHKVHFVASDCHRDIRRAPDLGEAYKRIQRLLGERYVRFFQDNARRVLFNGEIKRELRAVQPAKWYQLWR